MGSIVHTWSNPTPLTFQSYIAKDNIGIVLQDPCIAIAGVAMICSGVDIDQDRTNNPQKDMMGGQAGGRDDARVLIERMK